MLELGETEQNIARQAVRSGNPIPDRIANAPELREHLLLFLLAFFDLDSERSHGMTLTAISWTSVAEYAKVFEFEETQREDLFYFIRSMDNEHLKRLAKKSQK